MHPEYSRIWPWIFAILVAWILYRFRRHFGRQPLLPTRMKVRAAILTALGATLAPLALRGGEFLLSEAGGAALGVALALWGAERTRFINVQGRLHYVPHTVTGLVVSALLLARIVGRLVELSSSGGLAAPGGTDAHAAMVRSPLTVGLFFVLIAYYVCYYSRILWKSKRITPADMESSAGSSSPQRAR